EAWCSHTKTQWPSSQSRVREALYISGCVHPLLCSLSPASRTVRVQLLLMFIPAPFRSPPAATTTTAGQSAQSNLQIAFIISSCPRCLSCLSVSDGWVVCADVSLVVFDVFISANVAMLAGQWSAGGPIAWRTVASAPGAPRPSPSCPRPYPSSPLPTLPLVIITIIICLDVGANLASHC